MPDALPCPRCKASVPLVGARVFGSQAQSFEIQAGRITGSSQAHREREKTECPNCGLELSRPAGSDEPWRNS